MISETFTAYVLRQGLNWSLLKEMDRSPKHFKWRRDNARPDTRSLAMGRATHTAVFEPDRFPLDYAVFPGERRAGKEWEAFKAAHANQAILRADEYATCLEMRDAVHTHPKAKALLANGRAEQTVTWTNPLTGIACKGRLDWVSDSGGALCDLKTTANLDPPWFASRVANFKYHGQLAYYLQGLREMDGIDLPAKIIAVESTAPYDVAVFPLDEDALWAGQNLALELLQKVADCESRGEWPGRCAEEVPLQLPAWAFPADNDDDALDLTVNGQEV